MLKTQRTLNASESLLYTHERMTSYALLAGLLISNAGPSTVVTVPANYTAPTERPAAPGKLYLRRFDTQCVGTERLFNSCYTNYLV